MIYSYAKLTKFDFGAFRVVGSGLGNLLFPWARWIVATRKYNLVPISPTWLQFQIGPVLRQERDKRLYYDLFKTPADQIAGAKKIRLLCTLPRVSETEYCNTRNREGRDKIVIFAGLGGFFSRILTDHALIRRELLAITKERHKKALNFDFRNPISVHVRLGDFVTPSGREVLQSGGMSYRIPLSWYVGVASNIREKLGGKMPIYVFSDGSDRELAELLALPYCTRLSFGSAVADLIALSMANVLVGSASTFSMWASFLGRMPAIWYKGQMRNLYYDQPYAEVECGEGEEVPDRILYAIKTKEFSGRSDGLSGDSIKEARG